MIVPMKRLALVCRAQDKDAALDALRDLGAVHLDAAAPGAASAACARAIADAEAAVLRIRKTRKQLGGETPARRACTVADALNLAAEIDRLAGEADALEKTVRVYAPWGDFDPALVKRLEARGVDVRSVADLPEELPPKRLSELERDLAAVRAEAAEKTRALAAADDDALVAARPGLADRLAFAAAREAMAEKGTLACLEGWIPAPKTAALAEAAHREGWATLLRDPGEGEMPPTLVAPPRFCRPMKALFDALGIAPAYTEADVSVPFFCYFSLFFAMLVGDGAYGAIFLAITLACRRKLPKSWFALLATFSAATVGWGLLSNTWFGAALPWCAHWPTVQWLADPSYHHVMLLCFTIGVSHLMLARIWNGVCKAPDTTCLAEFGWAGVLLFMYLVTNAIVGIFAGVPAWAFWVFGVSLLCVFGFTVKPRELKTRGAELGMLPLSVMSTLGDVISYVRLFAVGLASVKVAENFNAMAMGVLDVADAVWAKPLAFLAMAAILVVGHGLNLAMAALSILVHAVRLNTLEFSNHKGVSWAGCAYRPFVKIKQGA